MECTICGAACENEHVTVDIVNANDMIRTQFSVGPFCRRCCGAIFREAKASLHSHVQTRKEDVRLHEPTTPFTHTTERPGVYVEGPNVKD